MAVDSGMLTQGTDFRISVDGVSFTSIGCVESWDLSVSDRPEIDTTCLTDTSKSFKFGLKDSGTLAVELIYDIDGPGQVLLEASYDAEGSYFFEVEYSDTLGLTGSVKSFQGFVIGLGQSGAKDDVIRQSVSIKISGDITTDVPTGP